MRMSDWSSDVGSSDLLSWDGQSMIYELGDELAQSERFRDQGDILYADIDVQRLRLERLRMGTFNDSATAAGHPEQSVRTIHFDHKPADEDICFKRNVRTEEHTSELQSLMRISYDV